MGQKNLPLASGRDHEKAFRRRGWMTNTTRSKNHIIMEKPGVEAVLSIPDHKEVRRGTLSKLIKAAGLSEDDYNKAFRGN